MIIDLKKFAETEQPYWDKLERILDRIENEPSAKLSMEEVQEFHYLYQRTSSDLARIHTFASEPEFTNHLESLVARAYGEIQETRVPRTRFRPINWFLRTFPQTVRLHSKALITSILVTLVGTIFGIGAVALDPEAKEVIMPFSHLQGSPTERVLEEEMIKGAHLKGGKASFAAQLMTHNTKVSILTFTSGITWGIGTLILLFYNGVIIGAVAIDYIMDGQARFLAGWLLPHGSVEIPAILLAGQAGFVVAFTMIGKDSRFSIQSRFRRVAPDLLTIIGGVAVILVWAGIVEAFFSQYHEPVLPYAVKILFGTGQLGVFIWFIARGGKSNEALEAQD